MKKYNVYKPESFGFRGSPGADESYAVFVELDEQGRETENGMLTYICNDDRAEPACIDVDNAEEFAMSEGMTEGLSPVFSGLSVGEDGEMTIPTDNEVFMLSPDQFRMLVNPSCVRTERGICWADEHEKVPLYRLDDSLDSIPSQSLDMRKFNAAIGQKWPALLDRTHCFCGKRYPEFPNLKYFEDRDKAVVFMTYEQAGYLPDRVLSGDAPLFRDSNMGHDWTTKNIYGICIVDDKSPMYEVHLIAPDKLVRFRDAALKQREAVPTRTGPAVMSR